MPRGSHSNSSEDHSLSRREFLAVSLLVGGSTLFYSQSAYAGEKAATATAPLLNGWIRISRDNAVSVYTRTTELGQGASTTLAAIVAEELELEAAQVQVEMAPVREEFMDRSQILGYGADAAYYVTWGSLSSRDMDRSMRKMAATARIMLLRAAAARWKAPESACRADSGYIWHADGRKLRYAEVAPLAAQVPAPQDITPKPRALWRRLGHPLRRIDVTTKVDGSAVYGIDVKLEGMLVATIAQCPIFGGTLKSLDTRSVDGLPGVRKVVTMEAGVAVIASDYWSARQALAKLAPNWNPGARKAADTPEQAALLRHAARTAEELYLSNGVSAPTALAEHERAMAAGAMRLEAIYEVPFLAHSPMEPMNATAHVRPGEAELWVPTQNQGMVRELVAETLGLPRDRVIVHTTAVGGGFGRRTEVDYAIQAAQIARTVDRPVKLVWSREEDTSRGYFRPMCAMALKAALDAEGQPTAFAFSAACPSIMDYSNERRNGTPRAEIEEAGLANARDWPYAIPARRIALSSVNLGVPVTWMRSVGSAASVFALECFLDEMAAAARVDPVDYRRRLLENRPRELAVVDKVVELAGWRKPLPRDHYRGFALSCCNGSVVAQIAEIELAEEHAVRVRRVHCVVDCGTALNPNAVIAQAEGGIIFGLTGALLGEITLEGGAVREKNFDRYPLLRLSQAPDIRVVILESDAPIGGIGEEAVPPVAPAIANALFAATGRRARALPLMRNGLHLAQS